MSKGILLSEIAEIMDRRIAGIIPGQKTKLLSALDELCRAGNAERPNKSLEDTLAHNFDIFRRELTELIQAGKDTLIPDRIKRLICGMCGVQAFTWFGEKCPPV